MNIILIIILIALIIILIWALLGGRSDLSGDSDEALQEHERTLRRRAADKEIEKVYPEKSHHPMTRKTDREEAASEGEAKPFRLPYLADEIIPETSRFGIYRRTLLNSEIYAAKGDFSTAISLFEGVRARIQDVDTRYKLDADIDYLKHFKNKQEEEARKKKEDASKGIARGGPGGKGELKITFGGSIPDAINIDSLPENINIGMIDPNKSIDMEAIVENVSQKMRSEMSDVRKEIDGLKSASAGRPVQGSQLLEELSGIKDSIEKLDSTISSASPDDAGLFLPRSSAFDQNRAARGMEGRAPALTEAKLSGPSRMAVPEAAELKEPASHRDRTKPEKEEEVDEFELLSEYGKDKGGREPTDEEIFEKILREDRPREKEGFEIIGEKKEGRDEDITTSEEQDRQQREDESFYRKLLNTNRRKKKELPILKVSYDFTKLPDEVGLSREKNIIEYAFYKYKPMLEQANEFIKKRKVRDAINYYKVVMAQNIPPEFKAMIRKNLNDLTEYLGKYLAGD